LSFSMVMKGALHLAEPETLKKEWRSEEVLEKE
jgi:hypothetical protein